MSVGCLSFYLKIYLIYLFILVEPEYDVGDAHMYRNRVMKLSEDELCNQVRDPALCDRAQNSRENKRPDPGKLGSS